MTTSAFPALTEAEQVFKDLIWNPMIFAGENWIEAEVPFLDLPVIKQLDEATLNAVTDAIFSYVCETVDIAAIQLSNAAAQSAYESASENLVVVATEKGVTSDEYKTALAQELQALAAFGHLAGG
jgi:hypothetical protein